MFLGWAVVGFAGGAIYGAIGVAAAGEYDPAMPSMPDPDRLPGMLAEAGDDGNVRRVVIFPVRSAEDRAQLVTGELRVVEYPDGITRRARWEPFKAWVSIPLSVEGSPASLEGYVASLRARGVGVADVRFAWWRRPWAFVLACGFAGAIVLGGGRIGLAWLRGEHAGGLPLLPPADRDDDAPAPQQLTDSEEQQLEAAMFSLNGQLPEEPILEPAMLRTGQSVPPQAAETTAGIGRKIELEKHYEGEYYPVERHAAGEPDEASTQPNGARDSEKP
jgi:hypothetical protein